MTIVYHIFTSNWSILTPKLHVVNVNYVAPPVTGFHSWAKKYGVCDPEDKIARQYCECYRLLYQFSQSFTMQLIWK